jgi:hypothetical protein
MAIQAFTADAQSRFTSGVWAALSTGDIGAPLQVDPTAIITVHCTAGTFGGSTLTWQGSLDGTNWDTIPDIKGVLMTQTATGILGVGQPIQFIRPSVAAGAGSGIICRIVVARMG